MGKAVSGVFATAAVAAMGFACGALAFALAPVDAPAFTAPERAPAVAAVVVTASGLEESWPAVFGTVQEVLPDPEPEPDIVVEPEPEENNTYFLTGIVAGEGVQSFAMIAENDRGLVVRVGDVLVGGETVTAIDARGVWIEFEGTRELIPVTKTDFGTMIRMDPETGERTAAATLASEITVPVEALSRNYLSELVSGSARLELTKDAGLPGLQVLSIREGLLFDLMGLRPGDTILSVDGRIANSPDMLADTPDTVLLRGALEFEILRDGARQTVKVTFEQS